MADYITEGCGCKGARYCSLCEKSDRAMKLQRKYEKPDLEKFQNVLLYSYTAAESGKCDTRQIEARPSYSLDDLFLLRQCAENLPLVDENLSAIFNDKLILIENFIDETEESELVAKIDRESWILSQSGRRKQDYGPRVNFKQQKLKMDNFVGMPVYCKPLLMKMQQRIDLANYVPFEVCNLEYSNERGSSIDFHIDDTWIWGDRLISINLLDSSVMTLINEEQQVVLYIPMPRRSLLCISGRMRYEWKHGIFRHHIPSRRIALTMREPAAKFRPGGELYEKYGKELIEKANCFVEV